jgi:hypothetical protein
VEPDPQAALAYGIFSRRQAREAGFSEAQIRAQVSRGHWVSSSRAVLEVVGRAPGGSDPLVRRVLDAGPQAVIGFVAAARLYGWDLPALPRVPDVIVPPGHNPAVPCYRSRLASDEVLVRGPVRVTTPARTAADLAVVLPSDVAVVVLDSALRKGLRHDALAEAVGRRRSPAARRALALADPQSGSVPESQARMLFQAAGLPAPYTQFLIRLGPATYRVDFAWPEFKLVVEIDGREFHVGEGPFQTDRTRQNALLQAGWLVLRFTVADVRLRPDYVVAEIACALGVNL